MKKIAIMILIIFMSTLLLTNVGYAIDIPLRVVVNGEEVKFPDAQPFIDANGRTQTPARFIGEALGATVTWTEMRRKLYSRKVKQPWYCLLVKENTR